MYYTWITNQVAIGELNSPYDVFDVVVDIGYINPSVNKGLEHGKIMIENINGKKIYRVGVYDTDNDALLFLELLKIVLSMIVTGPVRAEISDRNKTLFHCQAGKSRSVCMALAYLCRTTGMSIEKSLALIKERRPIVNPRPSFVDAVRQVLK